MKTAVLFLVAVWVYSLHESQALTKRASLTYKNGDVSLTSNKGKDVNLKPGQGGRVNIYGPLRLVHMTSAAHAHCNRASKGMTIYLDGGLAICDGVRFVTMNAKLGSLKNPAPSCKAILDDDWSSPSGAYYIKTDPSVTRVYCYMEDIPGCGKGGWTTIMKANGHLKTFRYYSSLWTNKKAYHVNGGQSGVDNQETKLPTYWTMPFKSLCLGMVTNFQHKPNWLRVDYSANSLYSVIADNKYRRLSVGRNKWKSLIPGSSLQKNCNLEGFNSNPDKDQTHSRIRIGILGNEQNECKSSDSRIGFGGAGCACLEPRADAISIGNVAGCGGDKGNKYTATYGYILAQ